MLFAESLPAGCEPAKITSAGAVGQAKRLGHFCAGLTDLLSVPESLDSGARRGGFLRRALFDGVRLECRLDGPDVRRDRSILPS